MADYCTLAEPRFEYKQLQPGEVDRRNAIYQWIKDGVGEFDVNDSAAAIPTQGVSLRESDGKIVIASAMGGTYTVLNAGDYVLKDAEGNFFVHDAATFGKQFRS